MSFNGYYLRSGQLCSYKIQVLQPLPLSVPPDKPSVPPAGSLETIQEQEEKEESFNQSTCLL